jgi:hypothetical protein
MIILPLLVGFLFAFNTRVIAQEKEEDVTVEVNIMKIEITVDKDYTEEQIESDTRFMKERGIDLKFKGIKRNGSGEITAISASYKDENGISGNYSQNSDTPIKPFSFRVTGEGEDRSIGFFSGTSFDESNTPYKIKARKLVVETDEDEMHEDKHKIRKRISVQSDGDEDSHTWVGAGEGDEMEVLVKVVDGKKIITINGEEVSEAELEAMGDENDKKRIVIKKIHKGDSGNVFIFKDSDNDEDIELIEEDGSSFFFVDSGKGEKPIFIVDGKEMSPEEIKKISPGKIEKVEILKGESATELYGERAKDGVIKIITKKN